MFWTLYLLVSTTLFHVVWCELCNPTDYAENVKQKLQNSLSDKYTISEGKLIWPTNFSSWGNNPSGVYGFHLIPDIQITLHDYVFDTLLYSHDAVVFAGCTPPPSKYFSLIPYSYYRFNAKNITSIKYNQTRTVGEYRLCAALGAGINHLIINTSNNGPFNALTTIIHTADNKTFNDIHSVLYNSNNINNNNDINLIQIPSDYFIHAPYIVNNKNYFMYPLIFDSYFPIWRIEIPLNETEFKEYTKPSNSQTVFYLKYKNAQPDDMTPFEKYTSTTCTRDCHSNISINETQLYLQDFTQYTHDVAINISLAYNYSFLNVDTIVEMVEWGSIPNYGYQCINITFDAGCNNPDSVYFEPPQKDRLNLTNKDYYIVIGVNSYKQNLSSYQSLDFVVNGQSSAYGGYSKPDFVLNNFQYANSAKDLNIKTNVSIENIENFYVLQFSRPNNFISQIMGFNITYQQVNITHGWIYFVERNYLHPLTKTQPDLFDLIPPVIIMFKSS
eukprot:329029_1